MFPCLELGGFVRRKCIVHRCAPAGVEHTRTAVGTLLALLFKTIVLHYSNSSMRYWRAEALFISSCKLASYAFISLTTCFKGDADGA